MSAITPWAPQFPNDQSSNFDAALGSVGAYGSNPAVAVTPPPQATIDLVIAINTLEVGQQATIELDKQLDDLARELHTLESLLISQGPQMTASDFDVVKAKLAEVERQVVQGDARREAIFRHMQLSFKGMFQIHSLDRVGL
ncbi:hypothetical protein [Hydrogenophaga sp. BPS33]|uniref:hypothetical protein n=1 Tax=Hydrogenophaga sp. BPS33 TaxID=2651974 RepID=UPI00131FD374|nr:hypothetical protein [Hydrogenophaga sp. BPS33]QHE85226.1 hypothetical protein F9K07_10150 [Hydrogenophaga sp. BPS33]